MNLDTYQRFWKLQKKKNLFEIWMLSSAANPGQFGRIWAGLIKSEKCWYLLKSLHSTTIFRLHLVWFTFLLKCLDPDFSILVVMQLSHCLKRRTSVNHLYQATSLVVSPANHSAYECLHAVRFILLIHFCGFNKNQFIYILVVKGDFRIEFTKTQNTVVHEGTKSQINSL